MNGLSMRSHAAKQFARSLPWRRTAFAAAAATLLCQTPAAARADVAAGKL